MTTAILQKMPHAANMGRNKMNRKDHFHKSITRLAGPGQVRSFHAGAESIERQRAEEKPNVFTVQISRVRRQILALRVYGSIDLWPLIPAEVFGDE